MRRLLYAITALLVAALLLPTVMAAPSGAVTQNCWWTTLSTSDPLFSRYLGEVKAGPFLYPGATSVDITCQLRVGDPGGPTLWADTESTPGSVGVYLRDGLLDDVRRGEDYYICTYTLAHPSGSIVAHGCSHAFTG